MRAPGARTEPPRRSAPRRGSSLPFSNARPEVILRPVRPWFVAMTLLLALLANLVPLEGAAREVRPDFMALVLLYWVIHEPRLCGVGTAWLLGLAMDIANGTVFGQHALAYSVLAYMAVTFRRRVLRFPLWSQALQVAAVLALALALMWTVRRVGGAAPVGAGYFLAAATGAVIWPPLSLLLQWPQRPAPSPLDL